MLISFTLEALDLLLENYAGAAVPGFIPTMLFVGVLAPPPCVEGVVPAWAAAVVKKKRVSSFLVLIKFSMIDGERSTL